MKEFEILLHAVEGGIPVQTLTLIAAPDNASHGLGQMAVIFPDGRVEGCIIDDEFTKGVVLKSQQQIWTGPRILDFSYQQVDYQVFWNAVGNEQYRAVILGGGHISQPLVQILSILKYDITVVDDRLEFASTGRFPGAEQVRCESFSQVLQELKPDEQTAVIIVTRGHQYDLDCLRSVIGTQAGYIGMIGSRRKVKATLEVLAEEGVSPELLQRVRAPIGLDLGGQSPEEIGVSIAAEVVATFKNGSCIPLSQKGQVSNHG